MNKELLKKFRNEVYSTINESIKLGYKPVRFLQMLNKADDTNIIPTIQRVVSKRTTIGLDTLYTKGKLCLSMEALITKPEYSSLFPQETINYCNRKLALLNYK